MDRRNVYFIDQERGSWLEQCVEIVRDAVLARRASQCRTMPDAIEQAALDFGMPVSRIRSLFYRQVLFVTGQQRMALLRAAADEADARARALTERSEAARMRRRQHELELGLGQCGGASGGQDSALGGGTGV